MNDHKLSPINLLAERKVTLSGNNDADMIHPKCLLQNSLFTKLYNVIVSRSIKLGREVSKIL